MGAFSSDMVARWVFRAVCMVWYGMVWYAGLRVEADCLTRSSVARLNDARSWV
jgi:hypothetical protein